MNELQFSVCIVAYNFSSTCFIYLAVLGILHTTGLVNVDAAVWNKQQ